MTDKEEMGASLFSRSLDLMEDDPLEEIFALNIGDFISEYLISEDLANKIGKDVKDKTTRLKSQLKELISIYSLDNTLCVLGFNSQDEYVVYNSIAKTLTQILDVDACHIDMLSASAHKLNGPKGIGFLYIRKGVKIRSFIHGGAQERKRRAGTENVPGIVGFGKAVERAAGSLKERTAIENELRDYLIGRIEKEIPYCRLNGHRQNRLPNNVNFSFQFVEGESLLIKLDMNGICASSGSACTSGSLDPSHVLLAIGLPHEIAHGSLRMTLSEETTKEELDFVVEKLKTIVGELRNMSPLYEDFIKKQTR